MARLHITGVYLRFPGRKSRNLLVLTIERVKKMKDSPAREIEQHPENGERNNEPINWLAAQVFTLETNIVAGGVVLVNGSPVLMITHGQPPHTPGIPARVDRKPATWAATSNCGKTSRTINRRSQWVPPSRADIPSKR